ncbi:MAG: flagellar basal-body MS-ring/collar protein FliF [Bryobacteraceae bacterium]
MDQLKKLFGSLSRQQLITIAVVVALVGAGLTAFIHWNKERGFKPLFTGMSSEDAAAIVQKLKEGGTEFRIGTNGSSVLVPEAKVDELRLEMSGAGLPKTGRVGFELFDKNNLGITDFTEHVNYRRALEGELERSIKTLNSIEQARVHLTFPKESVFLDFREPAKASVLVSTRSGAHLSSQNVQAISNLVASAVEGLAPDAVSILDMQGNLLNRPRKHSADGNEPSEASLDYKHQIEKDLVAKVESTLEPLLGEGHFRVGISADCDFSTTEQSDELIDPTKSVMLTSQKSEDTVGGAAQSTGVPGTPSNLPRAVPRAVGSGNNSSRRTESTSFETSKTIRHIKTPQGVVKRISASLLLDQDIRWEGTGKNTKRVLSAPSPEKLKAINDVVAGVLGLQTDRGDRLVIESLPFEQTLLAENTAIQQSQDQKTAAGNPKNQLNNLLRDKRVVIGGGAAGVVLLAALAFLFLRGKKKKQAEALVQAQLQAAQGGAQNATALTAAEGENVLTSGSEEGSGDSVAFPKLQLSAKSKRYEELRSHIKDSVTREPQLAADILRDWLSEAR